MDSKKIIITTTITALVAIMAIVFVIIGTSNQEFEVSFDSAGASGVEVITVQKNNKVEKPGEPIREGYTFLGWFDGDEEWDFDKEVTKSIILIAKWERDDTDEVSVETFTVTFNSNGGSEVENQTIEEGNLVSKPATPTRDGYIFDAWLLDGENYDFSREINRNITLTASWKKEEVTTTPVRQEITITFNSNGGSNVASQKMLSGNAIKEPATPTRDGYKFLGWYRSGTKWNFTWATNIGITLTARWEKVEESKPEEKDDVYTMQVSAVDEFSPEINITIYKNGQNITSDVASLKSGNTIIAMYSATTNTLKANKAQYQQYSNFSIELRDGSNYNITK